MICDQVIKVIEKEEMSGCTLIGTKGVSTALFVLVINFLTARHNIGRLYDDI